MYPTERQPDRPRKIYAGTQRRQGKCCSSNAPLLDGPCYRTSECSPDDCVVGDRTEERRRGGQFECIYSNFKNCKFQGIRGNTSPDLIAPLFGCCLHAASNLLNTAQDFAVDKNSGIQQEQWDQQGLYLRLSNRWRV